MILTRRTRMLEELVRKNRSYRRFQQDAPIALETLRDLVDLARLSASARNLQILRYVISCDPATNAEIFETLAWAGYLPDWPGPVEGERPAAYIVVVADSSAGPYIAVDSGLALQNILLGAVERGLGGCIVGSVQRKKLREILGLPEPYEIQWVLALGKPVETIVIEEIGPDDDVKYWRDAQAVHHVPKRRLEDLILAEMG
jgi:nitroreductase